MPDVVFLEFNELSPRLMARFLDEGHLPNFARLRSESEVYTTIAQELPPALEPWIQWVNVHSGLDYAQHGILNLDEGHKLGPRSLWNWIAAAGYPVLVCGSMNVCYEPPIDGVIIPDPWANVVRPYPASLLPYFRFIQKSVTEYTRQDLRFAFSDYMNFGAFMLSHGLSLATVVAIARQLLSERGGKNRWRRATVLDKLQFDVFAWYYRRLRPRFSTFFSNSTAHYQHLYWRNLEPQLYAVKPSAQEQEDYAPAILCGYQEMDSLVGRFYDLCDEGTILVLCTALSQQPCLKYEVSGGKVWYRPRDFRRLLEFAGLDPQCRAAPLMAEEFLVYSQRPETATHLAALRLGDRPVLSLRPYEGGLAVACVVFERVREDTIVSRRDTGASARFHDLFYQVEGLKSGMHHEEGLLWVRKPARVHCEHEDKVPLTAIAPTVLDWLGVAKPSFMADQARKLPCLDDHTRELPL